MKTGCEDVGAGCIGWASAQGHRVAVYVPYGDEVAGEVGRGFFRKLARSRAGKRLGKVIRGAAEVTPQGRAAFRVLDAARGAARGGRGRRGRGGAPAARLQLSDGKRLAVVRRIIATRRVSTSARMRMIEAVL